MKLSRRKLLYDLSAAGSATLLPLPGWALGSGQSTPGSVRILFEGPWLICPDTTAGGKGLVVRAPMDASDGLNLQHSCQMATWTGSGFSNPYTGQAGFFAVSGADDWRATGGAGTGKPFNSLFRRTSAAGADQPMHLGNYLPATGFAGDVVIYLPAPDSVCATGKLTNAKFESTNPATPAPQGPIFLTTILTYNSGAGLAFAEGSKHAALQPKAGQDLIFQLYSRETMADNMHPAKAFKGLMMRLRTSSADATPPPFTLDWPGAQTVDSGAGNCAGLGDVELGISGAEPLQKPRPKPGTLEARSTTPANCSSGGVTSGGDGGGS